MPSSTDPRTHSAGRVRLKIAKSPSGSFVGKVLRVANTVVSEIGSEIKEFKKDI